MKRWIVLGGLLGVPAAAHALACSPVSVTAAESGLVVVVYYNPLLASVDINEIHRTNAAATLFNLSGGQDRPLNPFPTEAVRAEFGADWGAIADFTLPQGNSGDEYRVGVLIALHRDDRADAYILGLLRTPGVEFDLLQKNFYALTYS